MALSLFRRPPRGANAATRAMLSHRCLAQTADGDFCGQPAATIQREVYQEAGRHVIALLMPMCAEHQATYLAWHGNDLERIALPEREIVRSEREIAEYCARYFSRFITALTERLEETLDDAAMSEYAQAVEDLWHTDFDEHDDQGDASQQEAH